MAPVGTTVRAADSSPVQARDLLQDRDALSDRRVRVEETVNERFVVLQRIVDAHRQAVAWLNLANGLFVGL